MHLNLFMKSHKNKQMGYTFEDLNALYSPMDTFQTNATTPDIPRTRSLTEPSNLSVPNIHRTSSGSILFLRKRSAHDQEMISRDRALDMIQRFEMSEDKPTDLNKRDTIKQSVRGTPRLSEAMGMKQAASIYQQKYKVFGEKETGLDGVSSEKGDLKKDMARDHVNADGEIHLSRKPSTEKKHLFVDTGVFRDKSATVMEQKFHVETEGIEVILTSPSFYSLASTEVETPSPTDDDIHFELPCIC